MPAGTVTGPPSGWAIPRARFVPPAAAGLAYLDEPIPIPHGQVTTQPSLIATMLEALRLEGGERVLEVGTGGGRLVSRAHPHLVRPPRDPPRPADRCPARPGR